MSEKQKALDALALVSETCKASLAFLVNPPQVHDPSLNSSNLSVLHKDFISLLSLVHGSITKASLVLIHSPPSFTASLEPLKELTDQTAALPHCVRLLQDNHGKTLAIEAINIAKDVLEGIKTLMQTFIAASLRGTLSGEAGDESMVRIGALHGIIDQARGQNGFSGNNLVAVTKVWNSNQESLDDGVNEVRGILENAESSEGDAGEEDGFDDGWGELGISSDVRPSAVELERIRKIFAIVRLSALFHRRLSNDVLSPLLSQNSFSNDTNTTLDDIAQASSDFLVSSDNLISTMYPPQVHEHLNDELRGYQRQLSLLQSKLELLIPECSIQTLQLNSTNKKPDYTKLRKWSIVCIKQINKNIHELEHETKESEVPLA